MYYCYGKGVQKSVLCREVVPFSEGPLSEVPLYTRNYTPSIVLCHSCHSVHPVQRMQQSLPD